MSPNASVEPAPPGGWPRITLVTPNYNQAQYLNACINSVLEQGYPNLEYMVIDGGSTDGSAELIRRYADRLAWWVSEQDRGQAHAINKGLRRATGTLVNWLCGDDHLLPGALFTVARRFAEDPALDVLVGRCRTHFVDDPERNFIYNVTPEQLDLIPYTNPIPQPSCFFRRSLLRDPPLDESYHYAMDTELWCYLRAKGARWGFTDEILSEYLMTGHNKTATGGRRILAELERLFGAYCPERIPMHLTTGRLMHPLGKLATRHPGTWRGRCANGALRTIGRLACHLYPHDRLYAQYLTYVYFDPR